MAEIDGILVLLPPPEGYVVDFDNPQRQAVPHAYWIAGVGTFLSLLFVAQRLYTKFIIMGKMQVDDVFLILSCIISYTVVGFCVHVFAAGAAGVHTWEIPIEKYNIFMRDVYLAASIYILGGSFAKIALLIFYFRLSPQKWFRISTWICLIFISGYTIGIFFALVFACDPISKSWDVTITEGLCINQASLYIATAVVNIASDVAIFCLPLPIVVKLQVPRRQKVGLVLIFLLGSLTIVTSCVRVSILPAMLTSLDQPWVISWATVWILVESNLFIICAALTTVRKFLKHVAHDLIGESAYGSGTGGATYGAASSASKQRAGSSSHISHGGRKSKSRYSQFDIERSGGSGRLSDKPDAAYGLVTYSAQAGRGPLYRTSDEDLTWADDNSEKGIVKGKQQIVQTTTVTVERS